MAATALGRDVQRLTTWASTTDSGDRDDLKPGVPDRSWSQVSVSARECIGVARCPYGAECFSERARGRAGAADIVVTNHALLAIDAVAESAVLPEHSLLVVDEAHELTDRVTSVATAELTSAALGVASRRISRLVDPELTDRLEASSATFASAIHDGTPGRIDYLDQEMATYLTALRDAASAARSAIESTSDSKAAATRAEAAAALSEISETASRILTSFTPAIPDRTDVVWLDQEDNRGSPRAVLRVAPLSVAELLRTRVFSRSATVLTSATLTIGGTFDAMAAAWGLTRTGPRRVSGLAWPRRRIAVSARQGRNPLRRRPSAAAGPRRRRLCRAAERDRRAHHRGRRADPGAVLVDAGRPGRGRGHARAAVHAGVVSRRRQHLHAGRAVHRRRGHLAVRHAVAVAGRRRAGVVAVVGADRSHPVSAAGRSAAERPPARGGRPRRQRLHGSRRQPCRAAARAGFGPAVAPGHRPRRGCRAGLPDGHRPLRRLPARVPATVLAHHRRRSGPRGAGAAAQRARQLSA